MEYFNSEGKRFVVTEVDEMPESIARGFGNGKWEWMRKTIMTRHPGDKPLRIVCDNKHEAECARVAAQNMVKGHKGHGPSVTILEPGYKIKTVVKPASASKEGQYFLFVEVLK